MVETELRDEMSTAFEVIVVNCSEVFDLSQGAATEAKDEAAAARGRVEKSWKVVSPSPPLPHSSASEDAGGGKEFTTESILPGKQPLAAASPNEGRTEGF
jgi:hypothetical protein